MKVVCCLRICVVSQSDVIHIHYEDTGTSGVGEVAKEDIPFAELAS